MEGIEVIEQFLRKQANVKKWAEGVLGYELSSDDLWEQLKTGVDLCRLMLKIKEGCVFHLFHSQTTLFVAIEAYSCAAHVYTRFPDSSRPISDLYALLDSSIPVLNENPRIQFVKKENIMFFIEAAKEYVRLFVNSSESCGLFAFPIPST